MTSMEDYFKNHDGNFNDDDNADNPDDIDNIDDDDHYFFEKLIHKTICPECNYPLIKTDMTLSIFLIYCPCCDIVWKIIYSYENKKFEIYEISVDNKNPDDPE